MGGRGASFGTGSGGGEAYVRMPPTALYKTGRVVVTRTKNGEYIFNFGFDKTDRRVDTSSQEYRRALRDYDVHASFGADGSVIVTKGGLFDRKRKFNSVDAFQKEANSRLDSSTEFHKKQGSLIKKGRISQLEAENLKSDVRNDTPNALKKFSKHMEENLHYEKVQAEAAQDMKRRLENVVSEVKKKTGKK